MWQIIINGPGYFDTAYDLPEGVTYLGRADNNDIVLSGDQVSRRHAKLEIRGGALTFEDLGSRNGSALNGERIVGTRPVGAGDLLSIGENTLAVRQPAAAESARTDPIDVESLHASGLHGVEIAGEVLVAREIGDNPFIEQYGQVQKFDSRKFGSGQAVEKSLEEFESLFLLIKVSEKLNTATSLKQFLEEIIDLMVDVSQAKTGVALLLDERGKLVPAVVRHGARLAAGEVPVSDAIIAEVARKKVAMAVMDAQGDARFAARESVVLYDIDQVICAPMLNDGQLVGIVYLNRSSTETMPLPRLVDVVSAIAHMATNGVLTWRLKEKALNDARVRKALERFHAPAVVERVIADLQAGGKAAGFVEPKTVTVMFADISGFTPLTERLAPERVVDLLNEYYARMTKVVFSFDGTVDKFIGDAVNIASRLQSSASAGQVLITGTTLAAIGARFDVAPLGERELKGKRHKVSVFEVLEEDSDMHTMPGV